MSKNVKQSKEDLANQTRFVYLLIDPRDKKPLYVGQARCVITRIANHLHPSVHYNQRLGVVLDELKALQLFPDFKVLEVSNGLMINIRERFWAEKYCKMYPDLCNLSLRPKIEKIKAWGTSSRGTKMVKKTKELRQERSVTTTPILTTLGFYEEDLLTDSNTFND